MDFGQFLQAHHKAGFVADPARVTSTHQQVWFGPFLQGRLQFEKISKDRICLLVSGHRVGLKQALEDFLERSRTLGCRFQLLSQQLRAAFGQKRKHSAGRLVEQHPGGVEIADLGRHFAFEDLRGAVANQAAMQSKFAQGLRAAPTVVWMDSAVHQAQPVRLSQLLEKMDSQAEHLVQLPRLTQKHGRLFAPGPRDGQPGLVSPPFNRRLELRPEPDLALKAQAQSGFPLGTLEQAQQTVLLTHSPPGDHPVVRPQQLL